MVEGEKMEVLRGAELQLWHRLAGDEVVVLELKEQRRVRESCERRLACGQVGLWMFCGRRFARLLGQEGLVRPPKCLLSGVSRGE